MFGVGEHAADVRISNHYSIEGEKVRFYIVASGYTSDSAGVTVEVNIGQQGNFLASGEAGKRRITIGDSDQVSFVVRTVDDNRNEADGAVTASLLPGNGYTISHLAKSSVPVKDNDLPVVSIAPGPSPVTEGDTATFRLTADPKPASPFAVSLRVRDGQFASGRQLGERTVTIGTDGKGTLEVVTEVDDLDEDDGTITATINAPSQGEDPPYRVGTASTASVSVTDGGTPTPRMTISAPSAIDEGETATFTVTARPKPESPINVTVNLAEKGKFAAQDQIARRTVTVGTDGTGTFTVATENDRTAEPDGAITATLRKDSGYLVGSPGSVSVAVEDITPLVSIAAGADIVEGGTATFTLTASPNLAESFNVTVAVSESGSFAANGETGSRTVTIGADGRGTLTVATTDDAALEADGTITAAIRAGSGYDLGSPAQVSVGVADTTPRVSIAAGSAIIEGDSAGFTLTADPKPSGTISVDVNVSESGSFLADGESGPRTVSIGTSGTATFSVATDDDSDDEQKGTITARIEDGQPPASYGVGATRSVSLQVNDNDAGIGGNLPQLSVGDAEVKENARNGGRYSTGDRKTWLKFPVTLDRTPPVPSHKWVSATFQIRATTASSTAAPATAGKDYRAPKARDLEFSFSHKHTKANVWIEVLDDDLFEEKPETIELVLVEIKNADIADGKAVGTILPDPHDAPRGTPVVTIEGGKAVVEGQAASFTVSAKPAPKEDLVVTLTVHDDGASNFLAAASEGSRTVVLRGLSDWQFDRKGGVTKETVKIGTVDDEQREADGSIRVVVETDPDPDEGGEYLANTPPYEATVNVEDNERAVSVVSIGGGSAITEGGQATFTLTADPAPERDLKVAVTVYDDNASDFVATDKEGTRTVTIRGVSDSDFARQRHTTRTFTVGTVDDAEREDDGSVSAEVEADPDPAVDGEYNAHAQSYRASVDVEDNERGVPTVTIAGGSAVAEGGQATFTLKADPAPEQDLTVTVDIAETGNFVADDDEGQREIVIRGVNDRDFAKQRHTTQVVTIETTDDTEIEATAEVNVTIQRDPDGNYDADTQPWQAAVEVRDNDTPTVSVAPPFGSGQTAGEGTSLGFTLNVAPTSATELRVNVAVTQPNNDYVDADPNRGTGSRTIVIPANAATAVVTVDTVDDGLVEAAPGTATVTVEVGDGYVVAVPPGNAASAAIVDNDGLPAVSIHDATVKEGDRARIRLSLSGPPLESPIRVYWQVKPNAGTATPRADYSVRYGYREFRPGQTERFVSIPTRQDNHDDPGETFMVELSVEPVPGYGRSTNSFDGFVIADGEAVVTIANDDPMPGAWLARFGRTVAEQALDGIAARMAAPRTPGMQGSIAGQALSFGGGAAGGPDLPGAPGTVFPVSPAFAGAGSSGAGGAGFGQETQGQARGMTVREVLQGSSFSLTGEADSSGGTLAFWGGRPGSGGLVSGARFAGAGSAVSFAGETTSALLGTDYARGRWLVGFALSQVRAEGGYAGEGGSGGAGCSGLPAEACALAARAGEGKIEASLTATIPYAAVDVTERLRLWGAAGQGAGDVTVKTGLGAGGYRADTSWSMAAMGLRGDLLAPSAVSAGGSGGLSLALTSDALWVRTSSERTRDLAASESDVTRLRVGLEGSWGLALSGGGSVTPVLELGARHDGGDAETGLGVELGGGVKWTDPGIGLSLDLSGRTLVAHDDGGFEDSGVSAQLSFDPSPASGRGLSFSLDQDWGGQAQGGLDSLFRPEPLEDREGSGEATNRWSMEAAWGLPAFGGRFTGSPHAGLGLATGSRDYSLGWRLAPEVAGAPDLSFGLKATRRESGTQAPEHTVGVEASLRW